LGASEALIAIASEGNDRGDGVPGGVEEEREQEEVHGAYERDDSAVLELGRKSCLYRLQAGHHLYFLAERPLGRREAMLGMTWLERLIYENVIMLSSPAELARIWQYPQKSPEWLRARVGCITGSTTGTAVGHQRGTPILRGAFDTHYAPFLGNIASAWGSGKEVYGTQCYVNDLQRLVTRVFRLQRRSGALAATMTDGWSNGWFTFRGQQIAVPDIDKDPVVLVRHYGQIRDPWNHHRGVSPDGVVFINNIPVGVLEVKCAFANQKALYVNVRPYYYDQLMTELYTGHLFYPSIRWLDFVVWSPLAFSVDTYTFDARYYYLWYAGRENRFYFRVHLKALAEKVFLTVAATLPSGTNPSIAQLERAVLALSTPPPPAPPRAQPPSFFSDPPTDPVRHR
jgi:hypothetical protein